uniref:Uncharacterized protein LOC111123651 n=1 Tax=Crassostrea virginica TaxID=6565 RepID=A0A8B8D188_CRAVI|nr:uncharacterized protein LOC111123651 [Crassostrea virginica]
MGTSNFQDRSLISFTPSQQVIRVHEIPQLVDSGFGGLDVNPKDNVLEYVELVTLFKQRDTNDDGNLSLSECQAHVGLDFLFTDPLFHHYDADNNQLLTVQEFVDTAYNAMDSNGDGQVTRHEFDHYYTQLLSHLNHLNQHHG